MKSTDGLTSESLPPVGLTRLHRVVVVVREELLLVVTCEDGLGIVLALIEEQRREVLGLSLAVVGRPQGLVERVPAFVDNLRGLVGRLEIVGGALGRDSANPFPEIHLVHRIVLGDRTGIEHGTRLKRGCRITGSTTRIVLIGKVGDRQIEVRADEVPALLLRSTRSPGILQRCVGRIVDHIVDLRHAAQTLDHREVEVGSDKIGFAEECIVFLFGESVLIIGQRLDEEVDLADSLVGAVPHVAARFGKERLRVPTHGLTRGAAHLTVNGARVIEAVLEAVTEILHRKLTVQACDIARRTLGGTEDILFVEDIFRRNIQIGARGESACAKNQKIIFQTFHVFAFFRI